MHRTAARATVSLALLVLAPAATALAADRQSVRSKLTTEKTNAPTGSQIMMRFANPERPDSKPYAVDKVVIKSQRGTRFDNSALPQCDASDAELMVFGEAACPPGSRVQRGRLVLDTGSPVLMPRLMHFKTTTFNTAGGFVSLGEAEEFFLRGVVRSRIHRSTVIVDYADAPGFGADRQSAMKTMFTSGPVLGTASRPFMRTPRRCPRSRRWTTRFTFIYHDGVRQTEKTHAPCRRG